LARRADEKFLTYLFKKIGFEPSTAAQTNLKRMDSIGWVRKDLSLLTDMDGACQHAAVQMAMASGMNRLEVFNVIEFLLRHGQVAGRRAAAAALAEFQGVEANRLAEAALDDSDPEVQANLVVQLRKRGVAGALRRLIDLVDSRHEVVRRAARSCLTEFSFERFLASFDMLDEDVRKSTGALVKRVDPTAASGLAREMRSQSRSRRIRALAVARAMEMASQLEDKIIEMLSADDHTLRAEAARALEGCHTLKTRQALRAALLDRSVIVQQAAESSLQASAKQRSARAGHRSEEATRS
jgi:HEAT repeat protein